MLGTLAVVVLVGELAARWLWDDPSARARAGHAELGPLRNLDAPNLHGSFFGIPFRTNSLGFRGPEFAPEAAPRVRRIAITGDSFVMGWAVDEEDSYPAQLERLLNAQPSGARYEVINVGLHDINVAQAMERLARAVEAYSPHLVVYGSTLNDIVGPSYKPTYPPLRAVGLAVRYKAFEDFPLHLMRFLWPRWVALEEWFSPSLDYAESIHRNYFENDAAWADYASGLDRLASIARAEKICGHVLIHTNINRLGPDHPFLTIYQRIEQAASERGHTVTLSFPLYQGKRPLDLKISLSDGHPNRAGHALLAAALAGGIRALPDSCWGDRGASPRSDRAAAAEGRRAASESPPAPGPE